MAYTIKIGNVYYTLNENNLNIIKKMIIEGVIEVVSENEIINSDTNFYFKFNKTESITLISKNLNKGVKRGLREGKFFNYLCDKDIYQDCWEKYGIYKNINPENYTDNCLIKAIKNHNILSEKEIDLLIEKCRNRSIPISDVKKLAKELDIYIKLRVYTKNKTMKNYNYGNKLSKKIFDIGCIDKHYFIINNNTNVTSYSLNKLTEKERKENENWNMIYKKENGKFKKIRNRNISSIELFKILLENKNKYLKNITLDSLVGETQFYDKFNKIENLQYDDTLCKETELKEINKKYDKSNMYTIFCDFETITENEHKPYLCCSIDLNNKRKYFLGENCGKDFLNSIPNGETLAIAHNLGYDLRFLMKYLRFEGNPIKRGNKIFYAKCVYQKKVIHFKCSLALIPEP